MQDGRCARHMKADRNAEGIIFNIQKYSVNDGPGIRTVVFLKGCPLHCGWCANPESQQIREQVLWDRTRCLRCGHCQSICPCQAISAGDPLRIDPERCKRCGTCIRECPVRALKMEGERKTVAEVMNVVMQDLPFYEESGGGITLSGGELLMQPDFVWHLLAAAREDGLHTCCETTGMASPRIFERIIPLVDEVLFDIKHWDAEAHRKGTGCSNELPIANLASAIGMGKSILPRIPVIPGFNDSHYDAGKLAELLCNLGLKRCQLLPFHQFGENKYDLLDIPYGYRDIPALHREELELYREVFKNHGIDAFF